MVIHIRSNCFLHRFLDDDIFSTNEQINTLYLEYHFLSAFNILIFGLTSSWISCSCVVCMWPGVGVGVGVLLFIVEYDLFVFHNIGWWMQCNFCRTWKARHVEWSQNAVALGTCLWYDIPPLGVVPLWIYRCFVEP